MKTGFREHLFASILMASAILFSLGGFSNSTFLTAALFFIFGSLMPDVDHPKSTPRKAFRAVFFVLLYSSIFVSLILFSKEPAQQHLFSAAVALIASFFLVFLIECAIPKHRGVFHSIFAALFFGALIFFIGFFFVSLDRALFFCIFGAGGYAFHLLVDFVGDRL